MIYIVAFSITKASVWGIHMDFSGSDLPSKINENNSINILGYFWVYNMEGKITECWLVETEGIFS